MDSGLNAWSPRCDEIELKTAGSTIPQPATSIHLGSWPSILSLTSISKLGSVNGKKWGRKRTSVSSPNMAWRKYSSVPLRSPSLTSWSTYSPSS